MSARRACPLCGGRRGRPIWHESGHRYLRCASCGMAFADVDEATYAAARHNAWDERELTAATSEFYETARRPVHERFLAEAGPADGRSLLDIGCGLGVFLEAAQRAGWDVQGCDTSEPWVDRARRRVGHDRVVLGEASEGLLGGRRFDLVTLWDVIEHIWDPVAALRAAGRLVAPGGRLFIRTPNLAYVWPVYALRRRAGHEVELGPLNHVVYFTAPTMRRALRRAGFEPTRWPVIVPPQMAVGGGSDATARSVRVKNAWAATADRLASVSGGRIALGSDLDVFARPS